MTDLDLRQIRYFLAVAQERSFTRAARRLGISQPALSRAIRSLEKTVGGELFVRKPRAAELTDAGEILAGEVAVLDMQATRALRKAQQAARATRSPIRLSVRGCDGSLADRLVRACAARMPGQLTEVVISDPVAQPAAVRSGVCQVAIVRAPFDSRELDSETLLVEPRVALVAERHRLAGRGEVSLVDLADDPVVMGPVADERERVYWAGADRAPRPWREGPKVRDSLEILAAVGLGQAIAFVPRSMMPSEHVPGVVMLRVRELSPSSLQLAWHPSNSDRAVVRFVHLALQVSKTFEAEQGDFGAARADVHTS